MNFELELKKLKEQGYNSLNAQARLCQDIILLGISSGKYRNNVTVKGGVVMRNISHNIRRATQDIDIDFIRYSLSDESICTFLEEISFAAGVSVCISKKIEALKHEDYQGKRVYVTFKDDQGKEISGKIDIGVHTNLNIKQDEFYFDVCTMENAVCLLTNNPAQIITEKLKALIRFRSLSTRYKDIYDIYYLLNMTDANILNTCIDKLIYADRTLSANNKEDIVKILISVYENEEFNRKLVGSKKNWLNIDEKTVFEGIIDYVNRSLK